jgi:cysteine-rich repeat protein
VRNKVTLIIGLLVLLGTIFPSLARAEEPPSPNCLDSLYEKEFVCDSAKVRSFCSETPFASEPANKLVSPSAKFAFYQNALCNVERGHEDDILEAAAAQMNVLEPNWTKELVKIVLDFNMSPQALAKYAGGSCTSGKLPESLKNFCSSGQFDSAQEIYNQVKRAYENERVLVNTKESLKSEFKGREMWANGSLSDAPFDLVVDLNLIEIVLFGSQAKWMDDVYQFPKAGSDSGAETAPTGTSTGNGSTTTTSAPGSSSTTTTGTSGSTQPTTTIRCEPPGSTVPGGDGSIIPGVPPDTVPPGQVPAGCGNGKKEAKEECDDGNTKSGDGCAQNCQIEQGGTLACSDPQAVNFKTFKPKPSVPSTKPGTVSTTTETGEATEPQRQNEEIPIECPPGTEPTETKTPPVQNPNYPGPNVGGVLKEFPPSNRPDCPDGTVKAEITLFGQGVVSQCVPQSACGDFEAARKLVYGDDYKNDPTKAELAASLESFICIKTYEENRPESPYDVNEGCIDCSIQAMNDSFNTLLEKNVSCLETNQEAWGLSSRWGPKVSLNLDVVTGKSSKTLKRKVAVEEQKGKEKSVLEKTKEAQVQKKQDATHQLDPNEDRTYLAAGVVQDPAKILASIQNAKDKQLEDIRQGIEFYRAAGEAEGVDKQFSDTIVGMLREIYGSLKRIQDNYFSAATALEFSKKKECTFD